MTFQSLRGFGVGWSDSRNTADLGDEMFQSLRGFGVGWSVMAMAFKSVESAFQSLRGFGVGWSLGLEWAPGSEEWVSIPERVWGGLEHRGQSSRYPHRSFNP